MGFVFLRTPERDFASPEQFIKYLMRMAQNKVVDAAREGLDTLKRDAGREEPLVTVGKGQENQRVYAAGGTPSEAAIGREMWEQMLDGQPPAYRRVLMLLREGRSQVEVAAQLNLSTRTVQRILQRALEKIQS